MNADLFSFIFKSQALYLRPRPKVQKKAYFNFGRTQVMEQLGFVSGFKRFTSFQLDKYNPADHQISVIGADLVTVEPHWNGDLLFKWEAVFLECNCQRFFVDFLKKTGTELVVNLVKYADDLFGQF